MITTLRERFPQRQLATWLIAAAVLALAALLGQRASPLWLGLLAAGVSGLVLLARPVLGLPALVLAALIVPLEISTGTEVKLNLASGLVPALLAVWLLNMVRRRQVRIIPSPVNAPLALFLAAGLFSLFIGRTTWDPLVPVDENFLLVQLAQWAIFAFSAGAIWLTGNLIKDETWLWRLTAIFLLAGGGLAILLTLPGTGGLASGLTTIALTRAPFWALLSALTGGQLLFNRRLTSAWRIFLAAVLLATGFYAFVEQRAAISIWTGVVAALGVLVWLRFSRLRWPVVILIIVLILAGTFTSAVYNFAGGDQEWQLSGASRIALSRGVIALTARNPITGLGPAAYRQYGKTQSFAYGNAYYASMWYSSHNNYVDLYSHTGILGLALFSWFMVELLLLAWQTYQQAKTGFARGFAGAMLATGFGAVILMMLADWILPFVYNIGFEGFQASVLLWMFWGGLITLASQTGSQQTSDNWKTRQG